MSINLNGEERTALARDDHVVDLNRADAEIPSRMLDLLALGPVGIDRIGRIAAAVPRRHYAVVEAGDYAPCAPVPRPGKIVCVGGNYLSHLKEAYPDGVPERKRPSLFLKAHSTVVGSGVTVTRPAMSHQLDYENELAVVIGRYGAGIPADKAFDFVAGYSILNDLSLRDLQFAGAVMMSKNFDGSTPMGPYLTVAGSVPDVMRLDIRTWVNDELRQDGCTNDMIFSISSVIEYVSQAFTLEPGDVISMGTPAGVAFAQDPPPWLEPGDVVRMSIQGLGELVTLIAPPSASEHERGHTALRA